MSRQVVLGVTLLAAGMALITALRSMGPRDGGPKIQSRAACPSTTSAQRVGPGGVALSWTIATRPPAACSIGFELPDGFTVGEARTIDALGTTTSLDGKRVGRAVEYVLSERLLHDAQFPLVIDPLISPLVVASIQTTTRAGAIASVATDGIEWLALTATLTGRQLLTRLTPTSSTTVDITDPALGQAALFYTDRFILLGVDTYRSGTWADLVDGGNLTVPPGRRGLNAVVAPGPGHGLLVTESRQLADGGGAVTAVRALSPTLEWDGGELLFAGNAVVVAEGSILYVAQGTSIPQAFTADLDGTPLRTITVPDGGLSIGSFVSDGVGTTLQMLNESNGMRNWPVVRVLQNGVPVTPLISLDDGVNGIIELARWDQTAFRLVRRNFGDNSLGELFLKVNGQTSAWSVVVPTNPAANTFEIPRIIDISATDAGTLISWASSVSGQHHVRGFIGTPGLSQPYAGGALFAGTNGVLFPFLATRGHELLVGWNDTREGGEALELWARRFDFNLTPLDVDATNCTLLADAGLHYNEGGAYGNMGQLLAATPSGYELCRTDIRAITLHHLDAQGRRFGPELRVNDDVIGFSFEPAIASNGAQTFVAWRNTFGGVRRFTLIDAAGQVAPSRLLPPTQQFQLLTLASGDFLVLTGQTSSIVRTDGGLEPGPWSLPVSGEFSAVARGEGDELLAVITDLPQRTTHAVTLLTLDGGTRPTTFSLSGASYGLTAAWDGRNYYVFMLRDLGDGGQDGVAAKRFDDAGWSAIQSLSVTGQTAVIAVPDGGLVLASGGVPDPIFLRRITWLREGEACGAPSDCESNFCVDGVCCESGCGGGAVDCQACSVAQGAAIDGQCRVLAAAVTCRAALSSCDVAEACDGTSLVCPPDAVADAGVRCGVAAGACDVDDVCDGVTGACRDAVVDAGVVCRSSASVCDVAERCDGVAASCGIDLESDAGLPECAPAALTFITPPTARCDEAQTLEFSVTGRAAQLAFTSDPSLDVTFDGTTLSWTPHADRANGTLTASTGGRGLADVQLRSDCVPRRLTVGCGCSSLDVSLVLGALTLMLRRARRAPTKGHTP